MYSRDGAIHFTAFKEMDKSPMHYAWAVANQKFDSRGMRLGRAVHALILQEIEPFVFTDGDEHAGRDMVRDGIVVTGGSDVEQWELMRRCKHHVIANSSFSWWAATLASTPSAAPKG